MQATTTVPLFSAALRPDRSFGLAGGWVALILSAIVALPLMVAVPDAALAIFSALAIATGVLTALSVNQARARRTRQQVTLWADQLEIVSIDSKGARQLQRFDPQAVRLILDRDENEATIGIRLRSGGETLELGGFLSVNDRASFARAFGTALRRARAAR
jgi:uncharacterized membrane protein